MQTILTRTAKTLLCFLIAFQTHAQNAEVAEAAARYKGEHAIVWQQTGNLRIQYQGAKLVGRSESAREVLLLTDRGAAMHNRDVVYYGFQQAMDGMEAETLVPNGSRYKTVRATEFRTTHSQDESIFYNDTKQTVVTFPSLSRYARTRLSYGQLHHDLHFILPFRFQTSIPVREATYTVTVPHGVKLGYHMEGAHTDRIKLTTEERRGETIYTWTAKDMPGIKPYENAPSPAYAAAHVVVYIKNYENQSTGATVPFLSGVGDLYRWYYGFIKNVDKGDNEALANLADSIVKGAGGQREKASRIYKWVQDHLRYVAYEDSLGGFIPRAPVTVCERRFGDCKDMASLLVALSRKAGIDAHHAWIGTRDIPYIYAELPSPISDNHMICMARIDGKWVYMDGTDRSIPFGMAPAPLQGKEALVSLSEKDFEVVTTPVAPTTQNTTSDTSFITLSGDDVKGDIAARYTGYPAWRKAARMLYSSGTDRDKWLRTMLQRGSERYMQEPAYFKVAADAEKSCAMRAKFSLAGFARSAGGERYLNMNLQHDFEDDYADEKLREAPIQYDYCQRIRQVVCLNIPSGFKPTYIPPDKADEAAGLWSYKLHYEQKGSKLWLTKEITCNTLLIQPAQFSQHNRLVEGLREAGKESVVLGQIN